MNWQKMPLPSRSVLRIVEEMGHLGIWAKDLQSGTEFWSPGLLRLLGWESTTEPMSLDKFLELLLPEDRQSLIATTGLEFHALPTELLVRMVRQSGVLRWLRLRSNVLFSSEGKSTSVLWIIVDITEQQAAIDVLKQQDRRLESLAETYKTTLFTASADGQHVNIHHWRALGLSSNSAFSRKAWLEGVHPADRERAESHWDSTLLEKKPTTISYRRISVITGEVLDIVYFFKPVFDSQGDVVEWVGLSVRVDNVAELSIDSIEINGLHLRAARALLDWSIEDMANNSGISISTIRRLEGGRSFSSRSTTWQSIKQTLEQSGILFMNRHGLLFIGMKPEQRPTLL